MAVCHGNWNIPAYPLLWFLLPPVSTAVVSFTLLVHDNLSNTLHENMSHTDFRHIVQSEIPSIF